MWIGKTGSGRPRWGVSRGSKGKVDGMDCENISYKGESFKNSFPLNISHNLYLLFNKLETILYLSQLFSESLGSHPVSGLSFESLLEAAAWPLLRFSSTSEHPT